MVATATARELRNEAAEALEKAKAIAADPNQTEAAYATAWTDFEAKQKAFNRAKQLEEADADLERDKPRFQDLDDRDRGNLDSPDVKPVKPAVANRNPDGFVEIAPNVIVPYASRTTEGFIRNSPKSVQLPSIQARYSPEWIAEAALEHEAFSAYVRGGAQARVFADRPELRKALNALQEDTDSEGGYLVPIDQRVELIHDPGAPGSSLRGISRKLTTSRDGGTIPTGTTISWGAISEEQEPSETNPAFGQVAFTIRKSGANLKLSEELLADSAVNLPAFIGQIVDEESGEYEDQQGIEGDGTTEPLGLRTTGVATIQGAIAAQNVTAAGLTIANMAGLYFSVPAQFRAGAAYIHTSSSFAAKMVGISATGGQQWMLPSMKEGPVLALLNVPIVMFDGTGWDDAATMSAAEEFGAIGDFNKYVFMDRLGVSVRRDDSVYSPSDQILFRARKRYDSFFTIGNAFRLITGA